MTTEATTVADYDDDNDVGDDNDSSHGDVYWKTRAEARGPFLICQSLPLGRCCPLGVKLSPVGEILCSLLHSSKQ
jgi:hypothetical protein